MEYSGRITLPMSREVVWGHLNDPEILRGSIPGCEVLEKTSETEFEATVLLRVGVVKARFRGKVELMDIVPLESYRLVGEGSGGVAGFVKGEASVVLEECEGDGGVTLLTYYAKAQVGGKLLQVGSRLLDAAVRKLMDDFFDNFTSLTVPEDQRGRREEVLVKIQPSVPLWLWLVLGVGLAILGVYSLL